MVGGATDEDAVGQFGDLDSEQRKEMTVVADSTGEREEGSDHGWNVGWQEDIRNCYISGGGVDEFSSLVVAVDKNGERRRGDVFVFFGGEAAGEWEEVVEGEGEGGEEAREDGVGGGAGGGLGEKNALLNVFYGE